MPSPVEACVDVVPEVNFSIGGAMVTSDASLPRDVDASANVAVPTGGNEGGGCCVALMLE